MINDRDGGYLPLGEHEVSSEFWSLPDSEDSKHDPPKLNVQKSLEASPQHSLEEIRKGGGNGYLTTLSEIDLPDCRRN